MPAVHPKATKHYLALTANDHTQRQPLYRKEGDTAS
ncbi:hypothetical protein SNOG_13897 [Parastagonospora nodorum SN15]|uniref:Uncharacterized protein n=1 Tax=Phaeosphaeria nodorum (strain SN15 / ATCC MYA-4574 / FGSC 10173) TaxID=321614 RepID=Q0U2W7_PHANO|nr:hypothetical protein SNOG_13897 [Parastagonospora nodorum SN15]EAT78921.1 hypothetical protein SNOG_13897 [Parastagonospora nodorum SN15]